MPRHKTRRQSRIRKSRKHKKVGGNHEFMDTITVPKGTYVFFCSEAYRTIQEGQLPPQPMLWMQLYPPDYEPTPKDSWYCLSDEKSMKTNAFYLYKLIRPITMLVDQQDNDELLTKNLIKINETLKKNLMNRAHQSTKISGLVSPSSPSSRLQSTKIGDDYS